MRVRGPAITQWRGTHRRESDLPPLVPRVRAAERLDLYKVRLNQNWGEKHAERRSAVLINDGLLGSGSSISEALTRSMNIDDVSSPFTPFSLMYSESRSKSLSDSSRPNSLIPSRTSVSLKEPGRTSESVSNASGKTRETDAQSQPEPSSSKAVNMYPKKSWTLDIGMSVSTLISQVCVRDSKIVVRKQLYWVAARHAPAHL